MELGRPASFAAKWKLGAKDASGAFEATVVLDDPAPFAGHYPGSPILPGNLLVEALFQAANEALGGGWRIEEARLGAIPGAAAPRRHAESQVHGRRRGLIEGRRGHR
ncbi:MAG: hypothetical protein QM765_09075 [Myxococcales bacterium]